MSRARLTFTVLSCAILALTAACNSERLLPGETTMTGSVVALFPAGQLPGQTAVLHVKESSTDLCGIRFSISDATVLTRGAGSGTEPVALSDLVPGQHVRVWMTGPVLESCPAQTTASRIELMP